MQDFNGTVIVQQPRQCAAPTPMVVTNINNVQQVASQQYPPTSAVHQAPPPYAATPQHVYPTTNDKAKLVQNEVLWDPDFRGLREVTDFRAYPSVLCGRLVYIF